MLIAKYIEHYDEVLRKIQSYCSNIPFFEPEDVMQELYFKVARPSNRETVCDYVGLLVTMAKNTAYDMLFTSRKNLRVPIAEELGDYEDVSGIDNEDKMLLELQASEVMAAAQSLTPKRRAIIENIYKGYVLKDVGTLLGMTWDNVRTLYYTATQDIRRQLCLSS